MMRVAHATDIHWFHMPPLSRLPGKRTLGTANLFLRGRHKHFSPEVQADLVRALVGVEPDAVLITGDLTAQALPEEFQIARDALDPVLSAIPTFVQVGNHDVYTQGAKKSRRIEQYFGNWMGLGDHGIGRFRLPGLSVVGLDPNRPHPVLASGRVPPEQLEGLPAALAEVPEGDALVLALHYPVVHRKGGLYDGWEHGLRNAEELRAVLAGVPRKPDLIIHGHVHHGYTAELDTGSGTIPTYDPGSSGYAYLPHEDRAACFNVYDLSEGQLQGVSRYRYGPNGFEPEPGGAYATGR